MKSCLKSLLSVEQQISPTKGRTQSFQSATYLKNHQKTSHRHLAMRFVLLLSLLASGLPGQPFGAAAPLLSTSSLSLKERTSKSLHLKQEFPSTTSSLLSRTTAHAPSSKRGLPFPSSAVASIATAPITLTVTKTRRESSSTGPLPNTVKRSKDTPRLTRRQRKGSAIEAKSPIAPDEEPKAWSDLGSRSSDVDNVNSHLAKRASTPDSAKDPDYNKKNGYWVPLEPVYYVLMGMGIVLAMHLVYLLVRCLVGGRDTLKYLKTWQGTVKKHWVRKAERRTAKNEVVAPA